MRGRDQAGYTLVELLVTLAVFSVVSTGFYQVMLSGTRGSDTAGSVVRISEEARAGFNRMVRDTREADVLFSAGATSFRVGIDFNGDSTYNNPNPNGDYEDLTFAYNAAAGTITLNGEVLVEGAEQIGSTPVFSYSSHRLEYDHGADWAGAVAGDGVTQWQELDIAPTKGITGVGNNNQVLDFEVGLVDNINFAFRVRAGGRTTNFQAQAQLRNRR